MNSAHHMITYACGNPASQSPFWFVTLLFFEIIDNDFLCRSGGAPCFGEQIIIHGWARNAPALTLPEGFLIDKRDK